VTGIIKLSVGSKRVPIRGSLTPGRPLTMPGQGPGRVRPPSPSSDPSGDRTGRVSSTGRAMCESEDADKAGGRDGKHRPAPPDSAARSNSTRRLPFVNKRSRSNGHEPCPHSAAQCSHCPILAAVAVAVDEHADLLSPLCLCSTAVLVRLRRPMTLRMA